MLRVWSGMSSVHENIIIYGDPKKIHWRPTSLVGDQHCQKLTCLIGIPFRDISKTYMPHWRPFRGILNTYMPHRPSETFWRFTFLIGDLLKTYS